MGTRFDIIITDKERNEAQTIWNKIKQELHRLNKLLNRFDPDSEISFINLHAVQQKTTISEEVFEILSDCKFYWEKTFGLFDISLNDFSKIVLDKNDKSVYFSSNNLSIDLGGYGKGYALGKVSEILAKFNVHQAFVDFGNSSIHALGHHPYGDSWKVSIENPYKKGEILGEFDLKDAFLSTSGNTQAYSNHIVHPKTGIYNNERKIVSVITNDPIEGEVLSTALMIASENERSEILKHFQAEVKIYNTQ